MSTIKLLSENGEIFIIPIAAARLSEVLHAEIECLDSNSNDDNDDSDDDGGDAHDGRGKHRQVDSTNNKSTPPVPPLSSHTTQRLSSAVLRKIADFVTHYVTEAEMSPLEPPFASEDMYDIVQPQWYADFITVGVDHALLLDIISAANYLSIQPLLKLAVLAISIRINGKSPNEIRPLFGISNDLNDPAERARVMAENEWAVQARKEFEERQDAT